MSKMLMPYSSEINARLIAKVCPSEGKVRPATGDKARRVLRLNERG